jgi:hypothetical protein
MIEQVERDSHSEGCWQLPGHHDCAIRMVEGLKRRLDSAYESRIEHTPGIGKCVPVPSDWRLGDRVRVLRVQIAGDAAATGRR